VEEIESLEQKKKRVQQRVQPALLRRFEILLERRQGKAIVPIRGKSCGACGLVLPVQTVIDVQTREFIITCESCTRFLYWSREEARARRKARKEQALRSVGQLAPERGAPDAADEEEAASTEARESEDETDEEENAPRMRPAAKAKVAAAAPRKKIPKEKTPTVKKASKKRTAKTVAAPGETRENPPAEPAES
jgi:hypothetical protein